jgi:3-oxoacid CoA-transferase
LSSNNFPQQSRPNCVHAVDLIITDLAVFTFRDGQLVLSELMPGATLADVQANTEAMFVNGL